MREIETELHQTDKLKENDWQADRFTDGQIQKDHLIEGEGVGGHTTRKHARTHTHTTHARAHPHMFKTTIPKHRLVSS